MAMEVIRRMIREYRFIMIKSILKERALLHSTSVHESLTYRFTVPKTSRLTYKPLLQVKKSTSLTWRRIEEQAATVLGEQVFDYNGRPALSAAIITMVYFLS